MKQSIWAEIVDERLIGIYHHFNSFCSDLRESQSNLAESVANQTPAP